MRHVNTTFLRGFLDKNIYRQGSPFGITQNDRGSWGLSQLWKFMYTMVWQLCTIGHSGR